MFIKVGFFIYLFALFFFTLYNGLNFYRIQAKGWIHPQIIVFLFPFIFNFLMAKFVFDRINPLFTTLAPCIMIYFLGQRMKKIRIFGLTGGIACGKSTLVRMMQDNIGSELAIIDCDLITAELREKGRAGYRLILSLLKEEGENEKKYLSEYSEEIKRQELSNYTFAHPAFLKKLAGKMGKFILWQIFKQVWSNCAAKKKLILIDAPTLFESKVLTYFCYPIIVVGCPEQLQVQRLEKTRKMTTEEALQRIRSQMPLAIKKRLCDIYIENKGTPEQMFCTTLKALNKVLGVGKK